jgi:FMN phosphatase YigB (HAD superfamily)
MGAGPLPSWNDTPTRAAIVEFVEAAAALPPEERVAVFDDDGTLWCEKPMPIELGFILERLAAMAEHDEKLRERQPWRAAREHDYAWLGGVITKHYAGDDSDVKVLIGGILQAFAGWTVDEYGAAADAFLRGGRHPTLGHAFCNCAYRPMIELIRYLEANGFTTYIASGPTLSGGIYWRSGTRRRAHDLGDPFDHVFSWSTVPNKERSWQSDPSTYTSLAFRATSSRGVSLRRSWSSWRTARSKCSTCSS